MKYWTCLFLHRKYWVREDRNFKCRKCGLKWPPEIEDNAP